MLGCTFRDSICRNLIIQNHGCPTLRFPLRTHNSTFLSFTALFQNHEQNFHLSLICNCVEQKIIQYQQVKTFKKLEFSFVFLIADIFLVQPYPLKMIHNDGTPLYIPYKLQHRLLLQDVSCRYQTDQEYRYLIHPVQMPTKTEPM